jgi:hypothetical protein
LLRLLAKLGVQCDVRAQEVAAGEVKDALVRRDAAGLCTFACADRAE